MNPLKSNIVQNRFRYEEALYNTPGQIKSAIRPPSCPQGNLYSDCLNDLHRRSESAVFNDELRPKPRNDLQRKSFHVA